MIKSRRSKGSLMRCVKVYVPKSLFQRMGLAVKKGLKFLEIMGSNALGYPRRVLSRKFFDLKIIVQIIAE